MKLNTYVNFRGTCAEAFEYYENHLGAKRGVTVDFREAPDQSSVGPDWKHKVMHATLSIGGIDLMGADIPNAEPMRSAYLTLSTETDSEAERIYSALAEGGQVFMPMHETFFASRYGQLRDRFGINWIILHPRPRPS